MITYQDYRSDLPIKFLHFKTLALIFFLFFLSSIRSYIAPQILFILFDFAFTFYLISIFRGKFRYLFLIHPVFVIISSFGFLIPFSEIGVGFTYMDKFAIFIDPSSMNIDSDAVALASEDTREIFGFATLYFSMLPIIWLPSFLYEDSPDILLYYSMSLFTIFYAALPSYISRVYQVLDNKTLLVIALYITISPTFFEINTTLHRYGMLVCGLFIFLITYIGLTKQKKSFFQNFGLIFFMHLSVLFIGLSKPQLIFILIIFILIDLFVSYRLRIPIFTSIYRVVEKKIFLILLVLAIQIASFFVIPEDYISEAVNYGGQLATLGNIPIFGFIVRVIYAALSPFPWIGFSQFILYGYNYGFLLMHLFSAYFASWFLLSVIMRADAIFKSADYHRTIIIFGISVILSLMFSAIGYHVYIAPALPFLAVVLIRKDFRIHYINPLIVLFVMEVVAQAARIFRL